MDVKKAALTVLSIAWKIVVIAVVIMGIYRLGGMAFDYGHSVFQEKAMDPEPGRTITVTVEDKFSTTDIAKMLQEKGLVEDWKLFVIQVQLSKYAKTLKPGTYTLTTAMKPREMMAVMSGEEQETEE
ncbi:MAG: endolytic transglycosylase MltG [Lachnospiraceae bacterium]|jgi:cell division protein YceG involved in septum cleavage|nr:endolytic transglycosylase MltG [Lachnospiraceae bacterium]